MTFSFGGNTEFCLINVYGSISERTTQVFQQFREHEPSALDKLVLVAGDVSQPRLGMSERDLDTLRARVSVVFHCAARVNFDSDLAAAVNMNVKGTRELVDLCHRLPHLQVRVLV